MCVFEAIEYANQENIDVIVLDHHQSEIKLPKAYSVVNPNRFDDKSNLKYLCAAGVSFMFLVSLNLFKRVFYGTRMSFNNAMFIILCLVINLFHMRLRDKMPNQLQTGYPEHLK